jgi:hypothetical protein
LDKKRIVIEIAQSIHERNRHKQQAAAASETLSEISDNDQELYSVSGGGRNRHRHRPDPVIYVTGLSNFQLDGDKLKAVSVTKSNSENASLLHLSKRINNNNNNNAQHRRHDDNIDIADHKEDEVIEIDKRKKQLASTAVIASNNSKYSNIRIKIDNDKPADNALNGNGNGREHRHASDVMPDESMDYQEQPVVSSVVYKPPHNIDLHNNSGYRVVVSNLHPKVTEDDILVRFFNYLRFLSFLSLLIKLESMPKIFFQRIAFNSENRLNKIVKDLYVAKYL